jgi:hypothetical protein
VAQVLHKTSTAFAIFCKITTIASVAKTTSGHGVGLGWRWELWHGSGINVVCTDSAMSVSCVVREKGREKQLVHKQSKIVLSQRKK